MCGIAGFWARCSKQLATYNLDYTQLNNILRHRGPDAAGMWYDPECRLVLMHRRLSIIDVTSAGNQPLTSTSGKTVVTFNGEIYNYQELRTQLIQNGYHFATNTDTEVLLNGYEAWGTRLFEKLDGDFAFALYDTVKKRLLLVRDRYGIKPLYVNVSSENISFASEAKFLLRLPWVSDTINLHAIGQYLSYLACPAPHTWYHDIWKVPAGWYMDADALGNVYADQWFFPAVHHVYTSYTSEQDTIDTVQQYLDGAVRKRLMSDVPVGAFLSGGLDSSIIAAYMRTYSNNVITFHVYPTDDTRLQEQSWAQLVARELGITHYEVGISIDEAFALLPKIVYHHDEPLGDSTSIMLYCVAEHARAQGIKVVLVGEGADELFCGYDIYAWYLELHKYYIISQKIIPQPLRKVFAQIVQYYSSSERFASKYIGQWAAGENDFITSTTVFSPHLAARVCPSDTTDLSSGFFPAYYDWNASVLHATRNQDFFTQMCAQEFMFRLPELILHRTDKITMAHGVESRVPFLDQELVAYAWKLPRTLRYRNHTLKHILRVIAHTLLPPSIINRPKMGFAAPVRHWFKPHTPFTIYIHDMVHTQHHPLHNYLTQNVLQEIVAQHYEGTYDYAYHLWILTQLYVLSESRQSV